MDTSDNIIIHCYPIKYRSLPALGHSRQLKSQYKIFLHTSCSDKIASIINYVTSKMLSLAEVLGI